MIHLYAVTARAPTALPAAGVDGATVESVDCGPVHAIVSEHPRAPTTSTDSALAHASVVDAVAAQQPALPIRFGVVHTDVASLERTLADAAEGLLATLSRVGDAVEFVVRSAAPTRTPALVPIPAVGSDAPGRSYLESRLAAQRRADGSRRRTAEILAEVTAPLAARATEVVDGTGRAGPERCFLVPRTEATRFAADAGAALAGREDLLLGGPWPPFTFAGAGDGP